MLNTVKEILLADGTARADSLWSKRRKRWEDDFDMWRLRPYDAGKGYYSYTSNGPRILADKAMSLINGAKLIIRVPPDVLHGDERQKAANLERFLYGCLVINDDRRFLLGLPALRDAMAWHSIVRGSYFVRVLLNKNKKGETTAEIDIFDAYHTTFSYGDEGMSWVANTKWVTKGVAKERYGYDTEEQLVKVIDFWDSEKNVVIVEEKAVREQAHNIGYCPVLYVRCGSMEPTEHVHYTDTNINVGESIFAPNRNIFPITNKTMSDFLTIVRRGVKVPLGYWSAGGQKTIEEDIYQVEHGAIVPMDSLAQEKMAPLFEQTMPKDALPLMQIISGEEQRGGFPHTSHGELGFRLSGFAINQLQASTETVIWPYVTSTENAYRMILKWLHGQFTNKFKPIYVMGRDSYGSEFGMPKPEKIKPDDISGEWHPMVTLEPIFPSDDAQRYQIANLARQPGATGEPMLSEQSIKEMVGVEDPDLEDEKIKMEWANALPMVKLQRVFQAQQSRGDFMGAQSTMMLMMIEMQKMQQQIGQMQGQGQPQGAQPTPPGTGLDGGLGGVSSSVAPPEEGGNFPAGAQGAAEAQSEGAV